MIRRVPYLTRARNLSMPRAHRGLVGTNRNTLLATDSVLSQTIGGHDLVGIGITLPLSGPLPSSKGQLPIQAESRLPFTGPRYRCSEGELRIGGMNRTGS